MRKEATHIILDADDCAGVIKKDGHADLYIPNMLVETGDSVPNEDQVFFLTFMNLLKDDDPRAIELKNKVMAFYSETSKE